MFKQLALSIALTISVTSIVALRIESPAHREPNQQIEVTDSARHDFEGIVNVVAFSLELVAVHPCVMVLVVPPVFVNQTSTTLPIT